MVFVIAAHVSVDAPKGEARLGYKKKVYSKKIKKNLTLPVTGLFRLMIPEARNVVLRFDQPNYITFALFL